MLSDERYPAAAATVAGEPGVSINQPPIGWASLAN